MKKLFRSLFCAALMAAALSVSAFAAQDDLLISPAPGSVPEKQGDFYVLVNGDYVTFPDAVPQIKNDRSCLPFVAVFEQLGFAEEDMTWDGETKTVTATKHDVTYIPYNGVEPRQGDVTVTLTSGSTDFSVQYSGDTTTDPHGKRVPVSYAFQTEVSPYIDPATSRTYIPFGLVADALGYNVGWDAEQKAVIIDDVDAILAANTATYALMDKYMEYNRSFAEKNQTVTGGYALEMGITEAVEGQVMDMSFIVDGDYDMVMAGSSAFQFDTEMYLDMGMALDGVDMTDAMTDGNGTSIFPMVIDLDMRGGLGSGAFYLQSASLLEMMGQPDMAGAWYKLDLNALFDQLGDMLGMDYAELMAMSAGMTDMEFEEYLAALLKAMPLTDADMTTRDYLDLLNLFLADSSFTKSGTKYVNKLPLGELDEYGTEASMCFTLYTNGSKVNGYSITMSAEESASGMVMDMDITMKDKSLTADISIVVDSADTAVLMNMSMDGTYSATSAAPAIEPPADAVIIDLTELMLPAA